MQRVRSMVNLLMRPRSPIAFCLICVFCDPALATIDVPPFEVTRIDHAFQVTADPEFPNIVVDTAVITFPAFSADLSSDTSLHIAMFAPQKLFRLWSGAPLFIDLTFGNRVGPGVPTEYVDTDGGGPHFRPGTSLFLGNEIRTFTPAIGSSAEWIAMEGLTSVLENSLFTSITAEVKIPTMINSGGPHNYSYTSGHLYSYSFTNSDVDPGANFELIPVPEPLFGHGVIFALLAAACHIRQTKDRHTSHNLVCPSNRADVSRSAR